MRIYLSFLALLMCALAHAQTPGAVVTASNPTNPLDPNGDGWITSTGAAFSGPLDETEFDLPFISIPEYTPEPVPDNQVPSTTCSMYELVGDASAGAESTYYYTRIPMGLPTMAMSGYFFDFVLQGSKLPLLLSAFCIDTDQKFGFTGPDADPNAVVGNPGFELELSATYRSTADVKIYDVDGVSVPSGVIASYPSAAHVQAAYALNQDADCNKELPGFIDFYVPFFALGISSTAPIRMVGATSELTGSVLGGKADDISGVDGNVIAEDDNQFIAAIGAFPSFSFQGDNNSSPSATDATVSLNENSVNGTAVHTVSATDPDGDALTFAITAGNTGTAFPISSSGEIAVSNSASLDFESTPSFSLTVTVSDGSLSDDALITVNLNDVNETPSATHATVFLDENSANGTAVHTVSATDPDGDALTYAVAAGNTDTAFAINSSGEITVSNSASLDYETTSSFSLTLTVSDGSLSDDAVITVNLNDVNETPLATDASVSLGENSANGTAVHTVSATDPDGDALTYAITAGNASTTFVINNFGQISVENAASLDYVVLKE